MINGNNINLRLVELSDAQFICELRSTKGKYLSANDNDVERQTEWLKKYKEKETQKSEYYFVIENKDKEALGVVRVYDFKDNSFCWGSWIIKDGAPKLTAIESALLVYDFAFNSLGFTQSHFDVRKENKSVVRFHQIFGAEIVGENENNYYFNITKQAFDGVNRKYLRFFVKNDNSPDGLIKNIIFNKL